MKKLISIIPAISMLAAFIPAVSASGETDVTENLNLVYEFGSTMYANTKDFTLDYTKTNGFWDYYTHYAVNGGDDVRNNRWREDSSKPFGYYLRITDGSWYAVKVNVPVAGTYIPTITPYNNSSSPNAVIYPLFSLF